MSGDVLHRILEAKRVEVGESKSRHPLAGFKDSLAPSKGDFKGALARNGASFILEVKKQSPSRGPIRPGLNLESLIILYDRFADAISVLTDRTFFGGSTDDLRAVRAMTKRPLLRKDFIIDPYQVYEARQLGADAVLLIVAALEQEKLISLQNLARSLNMDALVEVHNEAELDRALAAGADILGINNRNLKDLSIDLAVTERLAQRVPPEVVLVTESGISTRDDIRRLATQADAFLIGSAILSAERMADKVKELRFGRVKICGITRREDAQAAHEAGATWLGFIFYNRSPRHVAREACQQIAEGLGLGGIGVFVDHSTNEIIETARTCDLEGVQLHGGYGESAILELKRGLPRIPIIRVLSVGREMVELPQSAADFFLLDTQVAGQKGGTGRTFDYELLKSLGEDRPEMLSGRVFLAGGLKPENIHRAAALAPYALDLSSGVESAPGIKDQDKLERLFTKLHHLSGSRGAPQKNSRGAPTETSRGASPEAEQGD